MVLGRSLDVGWDYSDRQNQENGTLGACHRTQRRVFREVDDHRVVQLHAVHA